MADIADEFKGACVVVATGDPLAWQQQVDRLRTLDLRHDLSPAVFLLLEVVGCARTRQIEQARSAATRFGQASGDLGELQRMLAACREEMRTRSFAGLAKELQGLARAATPRQGGARKPPMIASRGGRGPSNAAAVPGRALSLWSFFLSLSACLGCLVTAVIALFAGLFVAAADGASNGGPVLALVTTVGIGMCGFWLLSVVLAISGITLGIISLVRQAGGRKFAVAGLVMGIAFIVVNMVNFILTLFLPATF